MTLPKSVDKGYCRLHEVQRNPFYHTNLFRYNSVSKLGDGLLFSRTISGSIEDIIIMKLLTKKEVVLLSFR
jgi:hypothetical protein